MVRKKNIYKSLKCLMLPIVSDANHILGFDVHVTVHRVKFLIIKPTRRNNFSKLFLE